MHQNSASAKSSELNQDPMIVSYLTLNSNNGKSSAEFLKDALVSINLQVKLDVSNEQVLLPYVPFDTFNNLKLENYVFLYGASGSGKSRAAYEIIRQNLSSVDRL